MYMARELYLHRQHDQMEQLARRGKAVSTQGYLQLSAVECYNILFVLRMEIADGAGVEEREGGDGAHDDLSPQWFAC